jgi:hypothetical protein
VDEEGRKLVDEEGRKLVDEEGKKLVDGWMDGFIMPGDLKGTNAVTTKYRFHAILPYVYCYGLGPM